MLGCGQSQSPLAASSRFFAPEHDTERQAAVRAVYGIGGGPYLLSLCTLEPRKNLPRLVRAFHRLLQENNLPELRLVLVGARGWKNAELFTDLESWPDFIDRVIISGFVPDADLAAVYSGAQAFLFPSLYEGFGLPALEAMQCKVPVITSNTSSLPENVGEAAITIDPTNEDEIAAAIL
jgi:glycosyltransferase involved in cell wall biosynthesis